MSTTTSIRNQAAALASVRGLIAGAQKHFPNGSFLLGKTAHTTASLVQALQDHADALTAVDAAHAAVKDALAALRASEAKTAPLQQSFTHFVRAAFSDAAAELGDFGMQPPKARTPLDIEKRLVATAKAKATRKARGTMGKKQRLAVKGDVTGVVVTPVTRAAAASEAVTGSPAVGPAVAPSH